MKNKFDSFLSTFSSDLAVWKKYILIGLRWIGQFLLIIFDEIIERVNIGQFFFRNGKIFPPYVFVTTLVAIGVAFTVQRFLGINNISDGLIAIIWGGVVGLLSVFWIIDNRPSGGIESATASTDETVSEKIVEKVKSIIL